MTSASLESSDEDPSDAPPILHLNTLTSEGWTSVALALSLLLARQRPNMSSVPTVIIAAVSASPGAQALASVPSVLVSSVRLTSLQT